MFADAPLWFIGLLLQTTMLTHRGSYSTRIVVSAGTAARLEKSWRSRLATQAVNAWKLFR